MSRFHQAAITKGVFGELSKIQEELDEAVDAQTQGQTLMLLIELSDIVGAVAGVARKHGFSLEELTKFAKLRSQVVLSELNEKAYLQLSQEEDQRNALGYAVEQALNKERGLPYDEQFLTSNQLNDLFPPVSLEVFDL